MLPHNRIRKKILWDKMDYNKNRYHTVDIRQSYVLKERTKKKRKK